MGAENPDEFYSRLKTQLNESTKWPSLYLYKFIVLTDTDKIRQVHSVFDNTGAVIDSKQSKNGKYTSLSIRVNLKNPDEVIAKYKEVGMIEGVISL
ncbi:DUF493 family protein [Maribacter sp. HTCC2170]|uniref:DUF493 family protein n=1 Tax=Maribacter sp. (strain HTCC2170 / KCCM 42371) TaxID=313603 RepID=UPI00006BB843|nr:DUF493 family protein [Maribacter sp. HTCC2170]EAQ99716.1 hypothetical protein FB2170_10399 [Maribacter sp. HTCC2170]